MPEILYVHCMDIYGTDLDNYNDTETVKNENNDIAAVKNENNDTETVKNENNDTEAVKNENNDTEAVKNENNDTEAVKNDDTESVESEAVKNDDTEFVENDDTESVENDDTESVENDDTESIENDDTIGDVRCIKNNTKICISHDDYHHPDDSLFVPKLLLYNKNFTNQQIIKRLINNKSLHMFKNYYNVEMLDSGLTKYKHYSLDSNNDMVLKGDHIDAIINKLKNMNNFIETVIALFKNLNVVFPQKKEDVKHDFCNENIYGNFNFIQIYGFLRME